ncbi:MAG: enoyl-CoA hydratase-related protein [Gammaproteobacteria bacterium]|nr:enoyl-CoA hydratase-related protein [Gammaproteobacteria bacterium]
MRNDPPLIEQRVRHTVRLMLNRPEQYNALNTVLIQRLREALWRLAADDTVRQIVIAANGHKFCVGSDVEEMQKLLDAGEDKVEDLLQLGQLLRELDRFPKPVVGLVQGEVYGSGVGLLACCDVVFATEKARFCLPEVRLGYVAALISPYILAAMGSRAAGRYMLTGEHFSAAEAKRLGLVHEVYPRSQLALEANKLLKKLQATALHAQLETKAMLARQQQTPVDKEALLESVQLVARLRCSDEGREGIHAFAEGRRPSWRPAPQEELADDL